MKCWPEEVAEEVADSETDASSMDDSSSGAASESEPDAESWEAWGRFIQDLDFEHVVRDQTQNNKKWCWRLGRRAPSAGSFAFWMRDLAIRSSRILAV